MSLARHAQPTRRLLALVAVLSALALGSAACGAQREGASQSGGQNQGAAPKGDVTIDMRNVKYIPQTVTIKAGDTVVWENSDGMAHTVTKRGGPGPSFDSGTIPPGGAFSRTFREPGKIDYVCTIHPNQTGVLNVK